MKWNDTKLTICYFQQCACVNAIYFAPIVTTKYRMKNNKSSTRGLSLEMSPLLEHVRNCTHLSLPHGNFFVAVGTPFRSAINWFVAKKEGDIIRYLIQLWRFTVYVNMYNLYCLKFNFFYLIS